MKYVKIYSYPITGGSDVFVTYVNGDKYLTSFIIYLDIY